MFKKLICLYALVLILSITGNASADLLVHWKFNDGGGTTATDSSGNGHYGILKGDPKWVAGKTGGALAFGGRGDRVIDDNGAAYLNGLSHLTICVWIKSNLIGTDKGFVNGEDPDRNDNVCTIRYDLAGATFGGTNLLKIAVTSSIGGEQQLESSSNLQTTEWQHVAMTWESGGLIRLYINGEEDTPKGRSRPKNAGTQAGVVKLIVGQGGQDVGGGWDGLIDDFRVYNETLAAEQIKAILYRPPGLASNPSPVDGTLDIPREVVLGWTPGDFANTHDVYVGTVFDDVNNASRTNPRGVLASQGHIAATYDPPGRLDFGQTYYWRIDEVNAPPTSAIFKGPVWSFTVEPVAYPIGASRITATAFSSNSAAEGPENTINGAGLGANGLHSSENTGMWLSSITGAQPTWIQYEFDKAYKLHQMWVWNYNGTTDPVIGYSIKEASIDYSIDGVNWTRFGTTHEFARGPGVAGYAPSTTVDLSGVAAKYVRITANSNWGGIVNQYGLSEVRFLYLPVTARDPSPDIGASDIDVDATLSWRAGREAAKHHVYLSTDEQAVRDGTAPAVTVTEPSYPSSLDLASRYYWRIDEVNGVETPTTWQGDVWSLSTQKYLVVDDFEGYTDDMDTDGAIFQTWVDGFEIASNGSVVGNNSSPFAERTIVHSGRQSMPLAYNNTGAVTYSEATRTFDSPQDWSQHGILGLTLRFYGDPANAAQQMYVRVNNTTVPYDGAATDVQQPKWQMWYIDLTALHVGNVTKLSLGFDRLAAVGGAGKVLIDDLRLYPRPRASIMPADPGTTGLQALYQFEGNFDDSSGHGRKGSARSNPMFVAGPLGQAISLDGSEDSVNIDGYKGIVVDAAGVQPAFSVSAWIKTAANARDIVAWGTNVAGQRLNFRVDTVLRLEHGNGSIRGTNGPSLLDNEWHHVAATVPPAGRMMDVLLYVDSVDVTPASTTTAPFNLRAGVDVAIGMGGAAGGRFFNGQIDEVRLCERALSAGEVAWLAGRTTLFDSPF